MNGIKSGRTLILYLRALYNSQLPKKEETYYIHKHETVFTMDTDFGLTGSKGNLANSTNVVHKLQIKCPTLQP